ncbi:hypothetical protein SAMN04487783_2104 [Agrococcus baldri]|uniref:Uncharacterized protein n=1 Tax=Agrococcus baldri TaxID=153730 RepID=A0AA94L085_9MICO|nr:hypothetical protein SAMN04487783_2104 [Agrococcus baldri]
MTTRSDLNRHDWPNTGFHCATCGWPLHASIVADGHATHPTCEVTS